METKLCECQGHLGPGAFCEECQPEKAREAEKEFEGWEKEVGK